jgi:hypothetical protein
LSVGRAVDGTGVGCGVGLLKGLFVKTEGRGVGIAEGEKVGFGHPKSLQGQNLLELISAVEEQDPVFDELAL